MGLKLGKFQLVVGLDSDKVELVTGETEVRMGEGNRSKLGEGKP